MSSTRSPKSEMLGQQFLQVQKWSDNLIEALETSYPQQTDKLIEKVLHFQEKCGRFLTLAYNRVGYNSDRWDVGGLKILGRLMNRDHLKEQLNATNLNLINDLVELNFIIGNTVADIQTTYDLDYQKSLQGIKINNQPNNATSATNPDFKLFQKR